MTMNFHLYNNLFINFRLAKFENLPQIFFYWKSKHYNKTSFTKDNLSSDLVDGKALETQIIGPSEH